MNYERIDNLELEATCTSIDIQTWEKFMEGATTADKKKINRSVKKHLPELYDGLSLNLYNPYKYFKTKRHLILVHSAIEYFIAYS